MELIRLVYIANILVAGWIGVTSLLNPKLAATAVFTNAYPSSEVMRLVGCLWLAITLLSFLGLWQPMTFSPVLLLQLIYKSTWLLVVALPAIRHHQPYPTAMAVFFLVWVVVLPFVIPWKYFLGSL